MTDSMNRDGPHVFCLSLMYVGLQRFGASQNGFPKCGAGNQQVSEAGQWANSLRLRRVGFSQARQSNLRSQAQMAR
jgi:hypothetical protein